MNTLVIIKTKYATIEQMFASKAEAAFFLQKSLVDFDVVSYEIRSLK